jgi:hypothetical protein
MSLCPGSTPRPDGVPKHDHFGLAGASLGKRGGKFKVDKGLLKCPSAF